MTPASFHGWNKEWYFQEVTIELKVPLRSCSHYFRAIERLCLGTSPVSVFSPIFSWNLFNCFKLYQTGYPSHGIFVSNGPNFGFLMTTDVLQYIYLGNKSCCSLAVRSKFMKSESFKFSNLLEYKSFSVWSEHKWNQTFSYKIKKVYGLWKHYNPDSYPTPH